LLDPVTFNLLGPINGILGSKRTQNYLEFLDTLQGKVNEAQFIGALGLDGLAYRTAVKMFHMIKGYKSYRNVSGKAIDSFAQGIRLLQQARSELRNFRILDAPMPPKGFYSITGELSQVRNDFIIWLAQHNLQFVNQVSSGTDFLIVGEMKTATTTKYKKAQELGIRMVKEEEVGALLKEYSHDSKS
jgi:NAD-dependent DNA ligase